MVAVSVIGVIFLLSSIMAPVGLHVMRTGVLPSLADVKEMNREEIMSTIFFLLFGMLFIFGASQAYKEREFFTSDGLAELLATWGSFHFAMMFRMIPGGLHDTYDRSVRKINFAISFKAAFSAEKFRPQHKLWFLFSDIFLVVSVLMAFAAIMVFLFDEV
jgi:hypothetical protein